MRDAIQTAISDAIPERDDAPWIVQIYVQDEPNLRELAQDFAAYANEAARDTAFTHHYLQLLTRHLANITRSGGLFTDTAVTGGPWRGQQRRVRATLYRRLTARARRPSLLEVETALNEVATKWTSSLGAAGIRARRGTGRDLYTWLLPWFNPNPSVELAAGMPLEDLMPYPGDEALPFGADFAESLTLSMPRSDRTEGVWWFDERPHTVVSIQG